MKTYSFLPAVLLAVVVSGSTALAQETTTAAPAAPTPVNGVVYVDKLPTPTSLLKDAEAEGLTIARMEQGPDRMIVVYKYANGSTRAFAYTTSVASNSSPIVQAPAEAAQSAAPASSANYAVVTSPPPAAAVYTQPAPVYYYAAPRYYSYYDPVWDGWAPLAIGLGLGLSFHGGWHGGGYHGGHGWHH